MKQGTWIVIALVVIVVIIGAIIYMNTRPPRTPGEIPPVVADGDGGESPDGGDTPAIDETPTPATGQPIKIGAILPLTGDAASYGQSCKRGSDLALIGVNAAGGIHGHPLHIIYEDSRAEPTSAIAALNKLVQVDAVSFVVGDMFSHTSLAIAPIAQDAGVVLLSPTASAEALPAVGDKIFTIYPSDSLDGAFVGSFVLDELEMQSVAIIAAQQEAMMVAASAFRDFVEEADLEIVLSEQYSPDTTDFRSILAKANELDPDCIFMPGYVGEVAALLVQKKELDVSAAVVSISTAYDPVIFDLARTAAEGLYLSAPVFNADSDRPEIREFVGSYEGSYNELPDVWAGYGYDAINVSVAAMRSAVEQEIPVERALQAISDYHGVTGVTTFRQDGSVEKELQMMVVKDGRFTPVVDNDA